MELLPIAEVFIYGHVEILKEGQPGVLTNIASTEAGRPSGPNFPNNACIATNIYIVKPVIHQKYGSLISSFVGLKPSGLRPLSNLPSRNTTSLLVILTQLK